MVRRVTERALKGRNDIVASPGRIDASSGGIALGTAFSNLGRDFIRTAAKAGDELTRQVVAEERTKGREAAMEGETTLADGTKVPIASLRADNSIRSQAFNEGVLQIAPNRFQTSLLKEMDRIEQETRGNPGAYLGAATSFYDGFRQNLPTELQADFDNQFQRLQASARRRQETIFVARQRDAARVTNSDLIEQIFESSEREAFHLVTTNPEEREIAGQIVQDQRGRLIDLLSASDPLGDPVYSAQEQASLLDAFDERVAVAGAVGGLQRAPNKEQYIRRWLEAQRSDDRLSFETIDKVESRLFTELRRLNTLDATNRQQLNREVADAVDVYEAGKTPVNVLDLRQRVMLSGEVDLMADLNRAEDNRDFMRNFVQTPLAEQQALLTAADAAEEMTAEQVARADAMRRAHVAAMQGLAADPYAYAQQVGVIEIIAPLGDMSASSLELRARQQDRISTQYGINAPFLRPNEAAVILGAFNSGDPDAAVQTMRSFSSLPLAKLEGVATQLSTESPAVARAFQLAARPTGGDTASLIVQGYQIGLVPEASDLKPSADRMRGVIEDVYGDIGGTDPAAFSAFSATTEAIYLARLRQRGQAEFDDDLLMEAAELAAGGVLFNGSVVGGVLGFAGSKVLPPAPGVTGSEFNDLVRGLSQTDMTTYSADGGMPSFADGRPFTAEMLRSGLGEIQNISGFFSAGGYVLESTGMGRYLIRNRAGQYIQSATGPYVIDLGEAWADGVGQ